jgi:hypothetical protein
MQSRDGVDANKARHRKGSCSPTLATTAKASQGWGTHFRAGEERRAEFGTSGPFGLSSNVYGDETEQ